MADETKNGSKNMAATSEDVTLATRWILEEMEKEHSERREWHEDAMAQNVATNEKHSANVTRIWVIALLRPIIELAILIVLIVKL